MTATEHAAADELLTSTQAGALLGKSGRTVTRLSDAGRIPIAHKLPGPNGAYLYHRSVIEELRDQAVAEAVASQEASR